MKIFIYFTVKFTRVNYLFVFIQLKLITFCFVMISLNRFNKRTGVLLPTFSSFQDSHTGGDPPPEYTRRALFRCLRLEKPTLYLSNALSRIFIHLKIILLHWKLKEIDFLFLILHWKLKH
uniref:Uncharacterized protein n=1 Tax=Cacopsylla melanoneura TaxID=428564 RepID=A0A8D8X0R2_9HEMI